MTRKVDTLPVDRDTWKLMHYDSMYFVPHSPYNDYDFLKILSMKRKEKKLFVSTTDEEVKKK